MRRASRFEMEGAVVLVPLLVEGAKQANQLVADQEQATGVYGGSNLGVPVAKVRTLLEDAGLR